MRKIAGRLTNVKSIDNKTAKDFLNQFHRSGATSQKESFCSLGLFLNDELIAVIQFCYPRTSEKQKKYTTELLRLAFKKDVRVIGGASKLVSHYKIMYSPADIFTYQDMAGEATDVYAHCGFSLVSQAKKKEYLVAPGKTLATGSRKEVLGMAYSTRYGPDRILGTKLGEIIDPETGKRKSNKRIFVEDLGWHVEETAGDRVWEWFNPDLTFYVYKITASDSDKYYYGVSHVKKANATVEDCLNDGYYGSGVNKPDNKFNNWKKKHHKYLQKEILSIAKSKAAAYELEKALVGDLWKTDEKCLNSCVGGRRSHPPKQVVTTVSLKECKIHGLAAHQKNSCFKCFTSKAISLRECSVHGLSNHRSNNCIRCDSLNRLVEKECKIHGLTSHQNESCAKCVSARGFSVKECFIHGMSHHAGDKCVKCSAAKGLKEKVCSIHGVTFHRGENCVRCSSEKSIEDKICTIHGKTKHQGNICCRCSVINSQTTQECPNHGETLFIGDLCYKCRNDKNISLRICEKHGETKHVGNICKTCSNQKAVNIQVCSIHGETKFQGDKCSKCNARASVKIDTCIIHGESKFQGDKCGKCTGMKIAHKRFHTANPNANCPDCKA